MGKRLVASFGHAWQGLKEGWNQERNLRIFAWVTIIVILAMIVFQTSLLENALLILTMVVMFGLELLNSQIERFLNLAAPQPAEKVRKIKDLSAGAVLLGSIGAIIIGFLIFLPYFLKLIVK
jgi:undecaprenol kinase